MKPFLAPISGDPGTARGLADTLAAQGDWLDSLAGTLRGLADGSLTTWESAAGRAFATRGGEVAGALERVSRRYAVARVALRRLAEAPDRTSELPRGTTAQARSISVIASCSDRVRAERKALVWRALQVAVVRELQEPLAVAAVEQQQLALADASSTPDGSTTEAAPSTVSCWTSPIE